MKLVTAILTDLYGPLAASVSGEDGFVCSLALATQPVSDSEVSEALHVGGCPSLDASLSEQTLEVDRRKGKNKTNTPQDDRGIGSRSTYGDDDFFSNSADKENRSKNSTNLDCSVLQSRKMSLKNNAIVKELIGDIRVKDVGKSTYGKLKTGARSASEDVMANNSSLGERRFLSSTPPLSQTFSANNDPTFGSLSSIDILSVEDQTTLAEILSQDIGLFPQDLPQTNCNKSATLGDQERDSLAAEGNVDGSSSSSASCLLTGTEMPIDPTAWSKGHVWARDGINIQVSLPGS